MKKLLMVLTGFLFLAGCSTTAVMKNPLGDGAGGSRLTLEQKLEAEGFPYARSAQPVMYDSGQIWMERLIDLVDSAQDSIVIVTFLASESDAIQPLYDALARKAEEGVDIWLMYDGVSYMDQTEGRWTMRSIRRLEKNGVHIFEFNPVTVSRLPGALSLIVRDHRKLYVVDGQQVIVGGMNMNHTSLATTSDEQHDLMFEFISPQLATAVLEDFRQQWNQLSWDVIHADRFTGLSSLPSSHDDTDVGTEGDSGTREMSDLWLFNQDKVGEPVLSVAFGTLFAQAKETILLTPLFPIFDRNMQEAIKDAVARGVRVVVVPSYDKVALNRRATEYAASMILSLGAELYIDTGSDGELPPLLHDKLMIVDDTYVLVGSANYNYRSLNLSKELSVIIKDEAFAREMSRHFQGIIDRSRRISEEEALQWRNFITWFSYVMSYAGA